MTFNFDNAFTFASESDLLPIWYTAPDPFVLTSPFTDYWDDPFGLSEFPTMTPEPSPLSSEYGYEINMAVITSSYDQLPPSPDVVYPGNESSIFQDQVESSNERDPNCSMRDVQVVDDVHWERPPQPSTAVIFGNEDSENNHHPFRRENPFCEKNQNFKNNNFIVKEECENFEKEDDEQQSGNIYINDDKYPNYDNNLTGVTDETNNSDNPPEEDPTPDLSLLSGVDDPIDFKLPASKSPIMEAMVVCAIKNWGISIAKSTPSQVIFRVTDFDHYYKISRSICSKQHPTEDIGSRVKSLRRWFENFPKKKDRQDNPNFLLTVKPSGTKKVNEMIERNTRLLGVQKRRRRQ